MEVLRASAYTAMPWKNGKGATKEVAVFPPGAGLNDFVWRVSMATLTEDAAFSAFDGVDRTLTVVEGAIHLSLAGGYPRRLGPEVPPFDFAGESRAWAHLPTGAALDFNVMVRRGLASHRVTRVKTQDELKIVGDSAVAFVVALSDDVPCHGLIEKVKAPEVIRSSHLRLLTSNSA